MAIRALTRYTPISTRSLEIRSVIEDLQRKVPEVEVRLLRMLPILQLLFLRTTLNLLIQPHDGTVTRSSSWALLLPSERIKTHFGRGLKGFVPCLVGLPLVWVG